MPKEDYFGPKSRWFTDERRLNEQSMRLWIPRHAADVQVCADTSLFLLEALSPPAYFVTEGLLRGDPDIWKPELHQLGGIKHVFLTDAAGRNIVDFTVAKYVVEHPDFQEGDNWRSLRDLIPNPIDPLIYSFAGEKTEIFALMGGKEEIKERLGLEYSVSV